MQKLPILLFLFSLSIQAQKNRTIFFGRTSDNLESLEGAHIINLNTNQATNSNFKGAFKIFARATDTLKITSVGYKTLLLILKKKDFGINEKEILLKKEIIKLDEIEIKNNILGGFLKNDIKQTPEDISIVKSRSALDFSNIDFNRIVILTEDEVKDNKYPDMQKATDPTQQNTGVTLSSFSIFTRRKEKRLQQRLFHEKNKDVLPDKIISSIGKSNFTQEFNIPQDKIYHFLDYCGHETLSKISNDKQRMELIEFINQKSKLYLKTINKRK